MADKVVRTRVAARGWVTRTGKKLDILCKNPNVSAIELTDAINEFDIRINNLDEAQEAVEQEIELSEMDNDIQEAADFRDKARISRIQASILIASGAQAPEVGDRESVTSAVVEANLPKLELPIFCGDVTTWTSFWEQYQAVVHVSELPDITKFSYLMSLLKGEAKAAINGLSLNAANYKYACDILGQRFGRPERIIFSHVQELLKLNVPRQPQVSILWKMYDELQAHVRSLEGLGISGEQYGVILTPLILSRLPPELRMEWARDGAKHESDLQFLLVFLQHEIERRERSQTFSKENTSANDETIENRAPIPTAAALHSSAETGGATCELCGRQGHTLERCYNLTKAPIGERKDKLRRVGACFRCLSTAKDHKYRNCQAKCYKCKGKHHALLCVPKRTRAPVGDTNNVPSMQHNTDTPMPNPGESNVNANVSNVNSVIGKTSQVLLQVARVSVHGKCGNTEAFILFDTGSDKTYISQHLVDKIGPEWIGSQNLAYASFGSGEVSSAKQRNIYSINLRGARGAAITLLATEIPIICAPMFCPSVSDSVLTSFGKDIEFVDIPEGQRVRIDILVGLDAYWKLMTPELVSLPDGLVAQRSMFGWVLSGPLPASTVASNQSQMRISQQLVCSHFSEASLKNFWDLESVGIENNETHVKDPVLDKFDKDIRFSEGRYVVSLPWKSDEGRPILLNNEKMAKSRLDHLTRRLSKDPELECKYHQVFCEMQNEGIIEEVPEAETSTSQSIFYMPHHPVVKESSLTTKVRPVFDASAKGFNGVSLNDCLETGPSMIPNLPGILLRFRRWKVALTADVTKAFHQVKVRREDQDVHRFLWNDLGVIRRMRFVRIPFGNKSSPFLLNATVKYHLSQLPPSRVIEELSENMYVDDWLSGSDDDSDGCCMLREADEVMGRAGMTLAKWGSNSDWWVIY